MEYEFNFMFYLFDISDVYGREEEIEPLME